jgi:hypothetical protein
MDIFRVAGCCNSFHAPTNFRMPSQVAGGCCICSVQIAPNISAILSFSFASLGVARENVDTAVVNVVNNGRRLEKGIDGCAPVFDEPFYNLC